MTVTSAQRGFWKVVIVVGVAFALFLLAFGWMIIYADQIIPGDISYPIKRTIEELRLGSNELNFRGRAQIFTELSNNRKNEIILLVQKEKFQFVVKTIDQMILMQDKALTSINSAVGKAENVSAEISNLQIRLNEQVNILNTVLLQVPAQDYDAVNQRIVLVLNMQEKVETLANRLN